MGKERSMTSVITMMQVLLFSMAAAVITVMAFGIEIGRASCRERV